ncbi:hypothetical protein [Butyrivibrio sp. AE3006]|uniref:hypothetical protein n=1 Tax=Butyrivibrio sp. AE3006 TaxID=1280673 RepID=UPI00041ECB41|nr:hypothetical protein [Butyrivibrio sp. AE3006]
MDNLNSVISMEGAYKDKLLAFILGSPENKSMMFKRLDSEGRINQNEQELMEISSLMESCRPVYEYAWLVAKVKDNTKKFTKEAAVELAVEFMPDDFVIKPFMKKNTQAVYEMMVKEYDDVKSLELSKEEGFREGLNDGIRKAVSMLKSMKISKEQIIEKICFEFGVGQREVLELV